jgi:hypothetical protein
MDNLYRLHYRIDYERMNSEKISDPDILRLSYTRLRSLNLEMVERFNELVRIVEKYREDNSIWSASRSSLSSFYYRDNGSDGEIRVVYSPMNYKGADLENMKKITPEWISERIDSISSKDIWIDNMITSEVVGIIQSHLNSRYNELLNLSRYDFEVLSTVRDFKILVNLYYVKDLAQKMGISTQLDPVLSFPLGANSISILEAAQAYNTIMSGSINTLNGANSQSMVPIIKKIVDREGEIIWEYAPEGERVLSERISGSIREILKMVIENGTGRNAKDAIRLSVNFQNGRLDLPVPAFGKTGTANRFTNSSFAGFIPGLNEYNGNFDTGEGYVIVSYVGYDDNSPMKGPHISISGASGALPLWIDTANAIANSMEYRRGIQMADLAFFTKPELLQDDNLRAVRVSSITGLPVSETGERDEDGDTDVIYVYSDVEFEGDTLKLGRDFEPIKGADNDARE